MNGFFIFLLTLLTYFETGSIFFFFLFLKLLKEEIQLQAQLSLTLSPPNISMHILHTVLYTFPIGTDKENFPNE